MMLGCGPVALASVHVIVTVSLYMCQGVSSICQVCSTGVSDIITYISDVSNNVSCSVCTCTVSSYMQCLSNHEVSMHMV